MESPLTHFSILTAPRVERTHEHRLDDILFIAIASIARVAASCNGMKEFGEAKEERLRRFLQLPGGIPSHDTFNRAFSALNPEEPEKCFIEWTR